MKLEESMKLLDYEMKKTDDLLYRMIPKPVAKRLRKGEPSVNTCEVKTRTNTCHYSLTHRANNIGNIFSLSTFATF